MLGRLQGWCLVSRGGGGITWVRRIYGGGQEKCACFPEVKEILYWRGTCSLRVKGSKVCLVLQGGRGTTRCENKVRRKRCYVCAAPAFGRCGGEEPGMVLGLAGRRGHDIGAAPAIGRWGAGQEEGALHWCREGFMALPSQHRSQQENKVTPRPG